MRHALLIPVLLVILGGCNSQAQQYNRALEQLAAGELKSAVTSLTWLAKDGHAESQYRLAMMHRAGLGVQRSAGQAIYWLQRSAQQDHVAAQYYLARFYLQGMGVPKNPSLAFHWLNRLAEQNFAPAQYAVGIMYERGTGVARDEAQSVIWLTQAASNGHREAMVRLIEAYRKGLLGLPQDAELAAYWQHKAKPKPF